MGYNQVTQLTIQNMSVANLAISKKMIIYSALFYLLLTLQLSALHQSPSDFHDR